MFRKLCCLTEGTSYMFLTGPKVVKTVTGEDVTQENLGGASVHSTKSGVTHFTAATEEEGLAMIRQLLSYIPQNNLEEAPYVECNDPIDRLDDNLNEIIPDSANQAYDMYEVIRTIVDNNEFFEIQPSYAKNIIIYRSGADVSREGVQRDILPIVEGSVINTKYGPVKMDHIFFIGVGAFHTAKRWTFGSQQEIS